MDVVKDIGETGMMKGVAGRSGLAMAAGADAEDDAEGDAGAKSRGLLFSRACLMASNSGSPIGALKG